ncbi:helix-turn-helix-domain containing protein type [Niveomyces insectorum RCEF 264]|uniref:Helix-turn-helix-domain containing protein type n=1 Tax=Niveomyces insectorum RCEF 264 TaxID=1081102 RepID=A0A162JYB9_9HYPO|nr:helix-turn-helix-domain containing protein type [Niveomyces insectorum RCEF 264]
MSSIASFSTYDVAVPVLTRGLQTLDHVLHKAEAYAKEKGLEVDAVFPQARLIEDQNPLVFQVQNATKTVRNYVNHLTGQEVAAFEDNEKTFADLHARIQVALELLKKVTPDVANSRGESQSTTFNPSGTYPVTLKVKEAVLFQGIPNFIFHLTTAYSILRAKGVPVGKADFIANFLDIPGFE